MRRRPHLCPRKSESTSRTNRRVDEDPVGRSHAVSDSHLKVEFTSRIVPQDGRPIARQLPESVQHESMPHAPLARSRAMVTSSPRSTRHRVLNVRPQAMTDGNTMNDAKRRVYVAAFALGLEGGITLERYCTSRGGLHKMRIVHQESGVVVERDYDESESVFAVQSDLIGQVQMKLSEKGLNWLPAHDRNTAIVLVSRTLSRT